jgi:TolB-like protein
MAIVHARIWTTIAVIALAGIPTGVRAQCPDGSMRPCAPTRRARPATPPAAARARRFLLLPFKNVTRKTDQEWLAAGAPLMLAQILGQFSDIAVVPEELLAEARRKLGITDDVPDAARMRRLAEETSGWTVVTGDVFAVGDRLRITVRSLDASTSSVRVRAQAELEPGADPRLAFDSLSTRLLEPTGLPAGSSLASVTTHSVDAFRAYAQGMELYHRARYRESEGQFARAVQLDSTFALAWSGLAAALITANGFQMVTNPGSPAYRAIGQAMRYSSRLPARDAAYLRAVSLLFTADVRRSHQLFDSLLVVNPYDLDAAYWVASMLVLAPTVDTSAHPPRLQTSLSRMLALSRMILDRDPRRRTGYGPPLAAYGIGAGMWIGQLNGHVGNYSSFGAMVFAPPAVREVPYVSGDTLALMPRVAFDSLDPATQRAMRRRSADAGWEWAERWLMAGPEDSDAHLWASRLAELREDYARAYREFLIADSIGIQNRIENDVGWKLSLLVRVDVSAAAALADSLLAAGKLTNQPFIRAFDRRRGYGVAALILGKRWQSLARMAELMGPAPRSSGACTSIRREVVGFAEGIIPADLRRAMMDTVAANMTAVTAQPALVDCSNDLATRLDP